MRLGVLIAIAIGAAASSPLLAQSVCVTPSCAFGDVPPICRQRATPRTPAVQMGNGASLVFVPANPKIEPGDCILWRAATSAHSSSGASCPDDLACGSISPPACQWDAGNVDSLSDTPTSTCYYDPASFPAAGATNYYCRIHATPTAGTMRGILRVTTEIKVTVDKDLGTNSVKLSWTGGGVTGDVTYKVAMQTGGDPTFPLASTTTVNPDGGTTGITFLDAGQLASANSRYYLVRNKQTNEP